MFCCRSTTIFYQLAGRLTDADVLVLVPFFLRTVPVESLLSESDRLILLFDDGLCIPAALSLSSCNIRHFEIKSFLNKHYYNYPFIVLNFF